MATREGRKSSGKGSRRQRRPPAVVPPQPVGPSGHHPLPDPLSDSDSGPLPPSLSHDSTQPPRSERPPLPPAGLFETIRPAQPPPDSQGDPLAPYEGALSELPEVSSLVAPALAPLASVTTPRLECVSGEASSDGLHDTLDLERGNRLGPAAGSDWEAGLAPDEEPDYTLSRLIGRGGQGEVWQAWQAKLHREVAVKRFRAGNPLEFLQEVYTAAELDHPNIIPVYDLGRFREVDGRESPLLAMKLARGMSWDKLIEVDRYARDYSVDTFLAKHLRVLIDVCNAVAYAHAKGIIHRDLKPHQVMVGEFGEVFLMDWGMALSVRESVPAAGRAGLPKHHTINTATNRCGTPAYMAPEQTKPTAEDLGRHTDVYLLGAILFELLAGFPPHYSSFTAQQAIEMAERNEIHDLPHNCPYELKELLRSALATDPAKRPESAVAFRDSLLDYLTGAGHRRESREIARRAADALLASERDGAPLDYGVLTRMGQELQRALQLWPGNNRAEELRRRVLRVHAELALKSRDLTLAAALVDELPEDDGRRPELLERCAGARSRLRRQAATRKASLWASLLLLLALASFLGYHTHQARSANERLNEQQRLLRDQVRRINVLNESLESTNAEVALQRDRAEDLMRFMLFDLTGELQQLGRLPLLSKAARKALDYFESIPPEEAARTGSTLLQRCRALINIGDVFREEGNLAEALRAYRSALELAEENASRDLGDEEWQELLAKTRQQIGVSLRRSGDAAGALESFKASEALRRNLASERPNDPVHRGALASSLLEKGQILSEMGDLNDAMAAQAEAERLLESLAQAEPENLDHAYRLALARHHTAKLLMLEGNVSGAIESARDSLALYEKLVAREPDAAIWRRNLAASHDFLGSALLGTRDYEAALESYESSLSLIEDLTRRDPANLAVRRELSIALDKIGLVYQERERLPEAEERYREAAAIMEDLRRRDPENALWLRDLAHCRDRMAEALLARGDAEGAVAARTDAIAIRDEVANRAAENLAWRRERFLSLVGRDDALEALGRHADALPGREEAAAAADDLAAKDSANVEWRADAALGHLRLADTLAKLGRGEEALAEGMIGAAIRDELSRRDPSNAAWRREVLVARNRVAAFQHSVGRLAEAAETYRAAVALAESLDGQLDLAACRHDLGACLFDMGRMDEAASEMRRAIAVTRAFLARDGVDGARVEPRLAVYCRNLGRALLSSNDLAGAAEAFGDALRIWRGEAERREGDPAVLGEYVRALRELAAILDHAGRGEEARPLWAECLAARRGHPDVFDQGLPTAAADLYFQYADCLGGVGDFAAAADLMAEAAAEATRLIDAGPAPAELSRLRAERARFHEGAGLARQQMGDVEGALDSFLASLAEREELLGIAPDDILLRREAAMAENNAAAMCELLQRYPEAIQRYRRAYDARLRLAGPDDLDTGVSREAIAICCDESGAWQAGAAFMREAIQPYQVLIDGQPDSATGDEERERLRGEVAKLAYNAACFHANGGEFDETLAMLELAVDNGLAGLADLIELDGELRGARDVDPERYDALLEKSAAASAPTEELAK